MPAGSKTKTKPAKKAAAKKPTVKKVAKAIKPAAKPKPKPRPKAKAAKKSTKKAPEPSSAPETPDWAFPRISGPAPLVLAHPADVDLFKETAYRCVNSAKALAPKQNRNSELAAMDCTLLINVLLNAGNLMLEAATRVEAPSKTTLEMSK